MSELRHVEMMTVIWEDAARRALVCCACSLTGRKEPRNESCVLRWKMEDNNRALGAEDGFEHGLTRPSLKR